MKIRLKRIIIHFVAIFLCAWFHIAGIGRELFEAGRDLCKK